MRLNLLVGPGILSFTQHLQLVYNTSLTRLARLWIRVRICAICALYSSLFVMYVSDNASINEELTFKSCASIENK